MPTDLQHDIPPPRPGRGAQRAPKWHIIYFVLAAFNILTLVSSLALSHKIMSIYRRSVDTNQQWADRLGQYAELGQLAAAVNAPGNNVFDSHDVAAEMVQRDRALAAFEEGLAAALAWRDRRRDGQH